MRIKGIIFDFGFTLFYFEDVSLEKYLECYKIGLQKSLEQLKKVNILSNEKNSKKFFRLFINTRNDFFKESRSSKNEYTTSFIFQRVLEMMVENGFINDLTPMSEEFYVELASTYHSFEELEWKPFPHTRETLEKISQMDDIKMAVLSNHPHHYMVKNLLKKYDLYHYFDKVITSAKFGRRKPAPEIFFHALQKLGLENDAGECLMCGDEHADIVGGHSAGLKTILCERAYKFPFEKEIHISEFIRVNNISEILNHIDLK